MTSRRRFDRTAPLVALLALSACVTSEDPGEGGFISGVSGITSGTYDARIAQREEAVAVAEARNARLAAEINSAESELARLKLRILNQRNALRQTDATTAARIDRVLNASPGGASEADRLAALRRMIADARALSADLERLSG